MPILDETKNLLTTIAENQIKVKQQGHSEGFDEGKGADFEEGFEKGFEEGKKEGLESGYEQGFEEGKKEGLESGYEQGFEEGKAEGGGSTVYDEYYDQFWDSYQSGGSRRDYRCAFFGGGWDDTTFNPKYKIIDTSGRNTFQGSNISELNVNPSEQYDSSGATNLSSTFYMSNFWVINDIDTTSTKRLYLTFAEMTNLQVLGLKLREDGSQVFDQTFHHTKSLMNIYISSGTIGQDIAFSNTAQLDPECVKHIITRLKDYRGTEEYSHTLTLRGYVMDNLEKAGFTDEDKAWLEEKGIIYSEDLTWALVIDALKWDLTTVA